MQFHLALFWALAAPFVWRLGLAAATHPRRTVFIAAPDPVLLDLLSDPDPSLSLSPFLEGAEVGWSSPHWGSNGAGTGARTGARTGATTLNNGIWDELGADIAGDAGDDVGADMGDDLGADMGDDVGDDPQDTAPEDSDPQDYDPAAYYLQGLRSRVIGVNHMVPLGEQYTTVFDVETRYMNALLKRPESAVRSTARRMLLDPVTAPPLAQAKTNETITIRTGQDLCVLLRCNPATGYVWKLNIPYDEETGELDFDWGANNNATSVTNTCVLGPSTLSTLSPGPAGPETCRSTSSLIRFIPEKSGYLPPDKEAPAGTPGTQQFVFRGLFHGSVVIAFLHGRPWLPDNQVGASIALINAVIKPPRRKRGPSEATAPAKSTINLVVNQEVSIVLGSSPNSGYIWKMVTLFNQTTGDVDPPDGDTAAQHLLTFLPEESGYVAGNTKDPTIGSQGAQKFCFRAFRAGSQVVAFMYVKPWLPDCQRNRGVAFVTVAVKEKPKPKLQPKKLKQTLAKKPTKK